MSFESAFYDLMPHSIVVKRFSKATTAGSSQGSYGTATFTTAATTYRGRFVTKNLKLNHPDGTEFSGNHVAWLATTASISRKDKVTFTGSTYEILQVGIFSDDQGAHHTRLVLN